MKRKYRTSERQVKVKDIQVDYTYQRPLDERRVAKMAETFDLTVAEPLHVSEREEGTFWIVDGNHRRAAFLAVDGVKGESTAKCKIYHGLTTQDEAYLFSTLNKTKAVLGLYSFLADVVAGVKEACEIQHAAKAAGLLVSKNSNDLRCATTLRTLYRRGGQKLVATTLSTMVRAFGREAASSGEVLGGLGIVLHAHAGAINVDRLVTVLAKRAGAVPKLIGDGRTRRELDGGSLVSAIGDQIIATYNVGLRANTLPPLRKSA